MTTKKIPKKALISGDLFLRIAPLIISVVAIIMTYKNNAEQDKKWRTSNLGNVEISDVRFFSYGEYKTQEINKINWGYIPLFDFSRQPDQPFKYQNSVELCTSITAHNRETYEYVKYAGLKSVNDMVKYLSSRGKFDSTEWIFYKHYQIIIRLENFGGTPCKVVDQSISYADQFDSIEDAHHVKNGGGYIIGKNPFTINPHQGIYTNFEGDFLLNSKMSTRFRLEFKYQEINGKVILKRGHLEFSGDGWSITD
jgi:hypothetical protein